MRTGPAGVEAVTPRSTPLPRPEDEIDRLDFVRRCITERKAAQDGNARSRRSRFGGDELYLQAEFFGDFFRHAGKLGGSNDFLKQEDVRRAELTNNLVHCRHLRKVQRQDRNFRPVAGSMHNGRDVGRVV